MKLYLSFGRQHNHSIDGKTYNKDCLALIEGPDLTTCRKYAGAYFGNAYAVEYLGIPPDLCCYPQGIIIVFEPPILGRPRQLSDPQRKQILLDPEDIKIAQLLGDGNVSAGIRKALAQASLCDPDQAC
jgi:hypothetical protein